MPLIARIGRPGRAALLVLVGALAGGGALAVANIPDSSGIIHACYQVTPGTPSTPLVAHGNVYLVDEGQSCQSGDHSLSWNATGPTGPRGPQGAAATGLTVNARNIKDSAPAVGHVTLGKGRSKVGFDIQAYGFAGSTGGTTGGGSGGGSGKVHVHDISVTKKVDKSSPALMLKCANGKHIPNATIVVRKAGKGQQEFLKYKLTDVIVSSYDAASNGGKNTKPQETVTLSFSKIVFE